MRSTSEAVWHRAGTNVRAARSTSGMVLGLRRKGRMLRRKPHSRASSWEPLRALVPSARAGAGPLLTSTRNLRCSPRLLFAKRGELPCAGRIRLFYSAARARQSGHLARRSRAKGSPRFAAADRQPKFINHLEFSHPHECAPAALRAEYRVHKTLPLHYRHFPSTMASWQGRKTKLNSARQLPPFAR